LTLGEQSKKRGIPPKIMSEEQLQQKIVLFERNIYSIKGLSLIFSIPNGGSRNVAEALNLKRTGLTAGVSDLILIIKDKIYFIELKTENGKQSTPQKDFETKVNDFGFEYLIFRNLEDYQKWRQSLSKP
jgi:hypothetical protein